MAKDLTADLDSLMRALRDQDDNAPLPAPKARGAFPSTSASGVEAAPKSTGGGAVGDLTETAYADRTFWSDLVLTSSDGIFSLQIKQLKRIQMTDSNGQLVALSFAAKP